MGVILWGESPLCELGSLRRSAYQMIAPIDKARGEGNCGGAISGYAAACGCASGNGGGSSAHASGTCWRSAFHADKPSATARVARFPDKCPLAHGQNHRQRRRDDQRLVARARITLAEISLGRACSASSNRVVRTRTLRGVGAGRGNPPGYPIRRSEVSYSSTQIEVRSVRFIIQPQAVSLHDSVDSNVGAKPIHFLFNGEIVQFRLEWKAVAEVDPHHLIIKVRGIDDVLANQLPVAINRVLKRLVTITN
jgi:hypothetical protein